MINKTYNKSDYSLPSFFRFRIWFIISKISKISLFWTIYMIYDGDQALADTDADVVSTKIWDDSN